MLSLMFYNKKAEYLKLHLFKHNQINQKYIYIYCMTYIHILYLGISQFPELLIYTVLVAIPRK